jgi:SAM-dependent methyltransferase
MPSPGLSGGRTVDRMTTRARSFGAVAAEYAEYRPGYPVDAVEWALAPAPGTDVLDLGAGTGKLTEAALQVPGVLVTAVDPDPAMLAELNCRFPAVDARVGPAEAIPLADASVDAVIVGQAWHWFDRDVAEPEIARVLRPGGVLAVIGNDEDGSVAWVDGSHRALHPEEFPRTGSTPADDHPTNPAFGSPERRTFPNPVPATAESLVRMVATHSWALIAEPDEREAAFARLRAYLAARPETSAGSFTLPLVTTVTRALRR